MNWKLLSLIACGTLLLPVAGLMVLSLFSRRPSNLGVVDGRLAACPDSPNCVSTQANDQGHRVEPLSFSGSPHAALAKVKAIVRTLPRTKIVAEADNYLHVEFTSAVFRFVDDVEFFVDDKNGQIHFRSASRTGYGDLGANRRRMEMIAAAFRA